MAKQPIPIEKKWIMTHLPFVRFGNCYPLETEAEILDLLGPGQPVSAMIMLITINQNGKEKDSGNDYCTNNDRALPRCPSV